MWITAWLLVGIMSLQQVMYPPFQSREDCEAVRAQYIRTHSDKATQCVEARIWVRQ